MAYASQSGRARTSSSNPQAHAICDRCGFRYNHVDLKWQFDWRGATIQNIKILVCNDCYDTPQEQLRAIVVPADPTPIMNARVQDFEVAESDYIGLPFGSHTDPKTGIPLAPQDTQATQDCSHLTTQPIGVPTGLDPNAVMPLYGKKHYRVQVPYLSINANGTDQVTVTCSSVHGLKTNDQITVQGLSTVKADGFYSIKVTTATAFTYQTNQIIPSGSLLTAATVIV